MKKLIKVRKIITRSGLIDVVPQFVLKYITAVLLEELHEVERQLYILDQ